MRVFIIGVSGAVGALLAENLIDRGDHVAGLVRRDEQRTDLAARGVEAHVAQLADLTADSLAPMLTGTDVVVYTAGSNGGARDVTAAIDGEGVVRALEAATLAGVHRFTLVSVMPEAGRDQDLSDDEEFYFAVKKLVDVTVSQSDLAWLILRPSMLIDRPGIGSDVPRSGAAARRDLARGRRRHASGAAPRATDPASDPRAHSRIDADRHRRQREPPLMTPLRRPRGPGRRAVAREIPSRAAICAFGTPSPASRRINAQSSKVITLRSS